MNEARVTAAAAEEGMATSPCETQETQEKGHLHWVSENKEEYSRQKRERRRGPQGREKCVAGRQGVPEYSLLRE